MAVATSGKPPGRIAGATELIRYVGRFAKLHLANILTVFRLVSVVPTLLAIYTGRHDLAVLLFALAALSDLLDGWYAKSTGTCTALGALLDPIADKVIVSTTLIALALTGVLPMAFALAVIGRDALAAAGYAWLRIGRRTDVGIRPTMCGKVATATQLILVGCGMLLLAGWSVPPWLLQGLMLVVLATLGIATWQYSQRFLKLAAVGRVAA